MEGSQDELGLRRGFGIDDIEASPVYGGRGGREGVIGVPEEGGSVGEVAERHIATLRSEMYLVVVLDVPDLERAIRRISGRYYRIFNR